VRLHRTHRGRAVAAPKAAVTPQKTSVPVRVARIFYAGLSSAFVACVVVQVFFAGMGAFGANWDWHVSFVHLFGALPLLMIPVAFVGRLSWGLRLVPFGLVVLVGVQYATANSAVPAAALHPVNALLIFLVSASAARRAWAAGRKKG
jgi:mercuric ion transport protein